MSRDGHSVLLVRRNKRSNDLHFGKYNGLGGKLDAAEDIVSGIKREILEEAGIEALDITLRGTISWPGFGKNGEDWFGFVFRIDRYNGEPIAENPEGTLEWVSLHDLANVNLWESDRKWLHMVFENDTATFHGVAPFENGKATSWSCVRI